MEGTETMKIGDLVSLSAYGKQRKRAEWISRDDVGLIVREVSYKNGWPPDYEVRWLKSDWNSLSRRWHYERHNTRADLKYAK